MDHPKTLRRSRSEAKGEYSEYSYSQPALFVVSNEEGIEERSMETWE